MRLKEVHCVRRTGCRGICGQRGVAGARHHLECCHRFFD